VVFLRLVGFHEYVIGILWREYWLSGLLSSREFEVEYLYIAEFVFSYRVEESCHSGYSMKMGWNDIHNVFIFLCGP